MSRKILSMVIRIAEAQDCEGLGQVQLSSWRTMFPDAGLNAADYLAQFSFAERAEAWQEFLAELPAHTLVTIAISNHGEAVGFAQGTHNATGQSGFTSELDVVHVLPDWRDQGIGQRLILDMSKRLQARGATSMWLSTFENNRARRLYERLGGRLVGKQTMTIEKNGITLEATQVSYGWSDIGALIAELRM